MKTQQDFVIAMQGMFHSRGYIEFFKPELLALRSGIVEELVYAGDQFADQQHALAGARASIKLLDQILGTEERVKMAALLIQNDPEEAASVLQSQPVDDAQAAS